MSKRQQGSALRYVQTLFNVGTIGGLTDGQLLEEFLNRGGEGGEPAFAALVERHGPMVLRTCQTILRDEHAVEDSFQATFLILLAPRCLALGARLSGSVALSSGLPRGDFRRARPRSGGAGMN